MMFRSSAPSPASVHDPNRLAVLDAYNVLDTVPEEGFDDLAQLAALACATPVALVSLVDRDRQWFKARVNFPACETDLNSSVCKFALAEPDLLVVPDLTADPRTAANPLVTGEPHIRFYAGAPLRTPDGHVLGSLCVIDTIPRPEGLSTVQAEHLRRCARQVMNLLNLRRSVIERDVVLARQDRELRHGRHLTILAEASGALLTASDPGRVIEPILATGAASLGFEQCFIYDIAPDGLHLRLTQSINVSQDLCRLLAHVDLDGPLCGIVVQTRRPLMLTGVLTSVEARYALARQSGIDAYAGYPILSRGQLVGVISFTTSAQSAFDEGALTFFSTIARYLSAVRERLDGEAALRASDARSRLAQEAGGVGTFELDVSSDLLAVSPVFCRLFGLHVSPLYSVEAILARILPEDLHLAADGAAFADGRAARSTEYRIRRGGDGALRWIVREAQPERDAAGRIVRWFGTVRDVTERQEAQQALRASEKRFRALTVAGTQSVYRMSPDWQEMRALSGAGFLADTDEPSVRWLDRYIDPADQPGVLAAIDDAIRRKDVFELEHRVRRADGRFGWTLSRAVPILDVQGEIVEWFGAASDVTERVQAEARRGGLLEFGDRLRADLDADAVALTGSAIIGRVLGVGRVGYGTVGSDGETFVVEQDWTAPGFPTLAGRYRMDDYGLYAEDLRQGHAVVIPDVREDPRTIATAANLEAVSARTLANLPIVEKGRTVAVLYVNDDRPRPWTDPEVAFVRQIAELIRQAVERRHAEERQDLLNHELSHRLKNTMAVVMSIVTQTLRPIADREPVEVLQRRIQALASAHDLLLRRSWAAADLRAVCREVLRNAAEAGRIDLDGPEVALGPSAALSASLLLHEMATNAQKYGSLSTEAGRVEVRWRIKDGAEGPDLVLRWRERGGPPVVAPTRRGFGSRLIRTGLVGTGGVEVTYPPDGVVALMRAPMVEVQRS